ncbi:MAG: hypothetical protein PUP91_35360, partial [Rhizonema sp. PD37]|nr:hypothetical protein [Rhizonema sp. PD37]
RRSFVANADARRLATASLTGDARSPLASPLGRRLANAAKIAVPYGGKPSCFLCLTMTLVRPWRLPLGEDSLTLR